jgi:23S rRNA (cytidine1920-2'-O)/16S rRNA (cytidine1409-2'-O)-methyltransferase
LILAGDVAVNGERQRKPSSAVAADAHIGVTGSPRFVSRGAYKLQRALDAFGWQVQGLRCLDVGASTGGFTDCLLQRGAASVVAVDVGYGHLAWSLRQNPNVIVHERTNFRHADLAALGAPFDFVCADVSFISLSKLARKLAQALAPAGKIVVLVKPQFEAGRQAVERGGVVRSHTAQCSAIASVVAAFARAGITCSRLTYSPIKGPAGNIEFLLGGLPATACRAAQDEGGEGLSPARVEGVVRAAHEALDR